VTGSREPSLVIVGAGLGGVAAAIELRNHGFTDVTILEKSADVGGTWFHNRYPAAACDVPSHLYSYSFAQRRDWSRLCSPHDEILGYLRGVAREHGVDRLVCPNTEITSCEWEERSCRWMIASADGRTWEADAVVLATGQLHRPAFPRIAGRETFAGRSFHSSEWDRGYDVAGRRVAVPPSWSQLF
jgi:cation diffusion facilitator CzcD-associated flavoprotein CzcO